MATTKAADDHDDHAPPTLPKTRGSWIRLKSEREWRSTFKCPKLNVSGGASAALTVGIVYITLLLLFTFVVFRTVPRDETQVYNITLTSEEYQVHIRVALENSLEPIHVTMTCNSISQNKNNIHVLFDWKQRLVVYKDVIQNRCYVRSSSGAQFQEEVETYRSLTLGKNSFEADRKPTVHYLVLPLPLSPAKRQYLLGSSQISFCSKEDVYWIVLFALDNDDAREFNYLKRLEKHEERSQSYPVYVDACLQNIVLHKEKRLFSDSRLEKMSTGRWAEDV